MANGPNTPELTADQARELLRYDPETGRLFWMERQRKYCPSDGDWRRWNSRFSGVEAFTATAKGYAHGHILGRLFKAHRIIWLLQTGEWPAGQIDHVNGVRGDNRWCNLRDVTSAENGRNAARRANNVSGVSGVFWNSRYRKWQAEIAVDRRRVYLGRFESLDAAAAAREAANVKHGYSERHGAPKP